MQPALLPGPVLLQPTEALPPAGLEAWAGACADALEAGETLLTLSGRVLDEPAGQVLVTAVLLPARGPMRVLRGLGPRRAEHQPVFERFLLRVVEVGMAHRAQVLIRAGAPDPAVQYSPSPA